MTENDAQLELKKRARRRLVGAVALAVLAAIVLPMVMDQEPKPTAQDIQIRIPSQDAGSFTARILPPKPGALPTPLPPVPEAKPAEAAAPAVAPAPSQTAPASPETPKAEAANPPPASAAKPPEKEAAKPVEKPAAKPVEKAAEKAAAPAKTEKAAASGQWIVQIGAYRDPANVRNLQAKLKEQGYNFYTEALLADGVKKTRVRAGPFASKEAAEKARERLKRIGVDGVVAPKAPAS